MQRQIFKMIIWFYKQKPTKLFISALDKLVLNPILEVDEYARTLSKHHGIEIEGCRLQTLHASRSRISQPIKQSLWSITGHMSLEETKYFRPQHHHYYWEFASPQNSMILQRKQPICFWCLIVHFLELKSSSTWPTTLPTFLVVRTMARKQEWNMMELRLLFELSVNENVL